MSASAHDDPSGSSQRDVNLFTILEKLNLQCPICKTFSKGTAVKCSVCKSYYHAWCADPTFNMSGESWVHRPWQCGKHRKTAGANNLALSLTKIDGELYELRDGMKLLIDELRTTNEHLAQIQQHTSSSSVPDSPTQSFSPKRSSNPWLDKLLDTPSPTRTQTQEQLFGPTQFSSPPKRQASSPLSSPPRTPSEHYRYLQSLISSPAKHQLPSPLKFSSPPRTQSQQHPPVPTQSSSPTRRQVSSPTRPSSPLRSRSQPYPQQSPRGQYGAEMHPIPGPSSQQPQRILQRRSEVLFSPEKPEEESKPKK